MQHLLPARLACVPAVTVLLLGLLASSAAATEILKLKNGDFVPGEVVELTDKGLTFARQKGGEFTIGWDAVLPISRFELWESSLATDDTAARLALAEWAIENKLHHQARREALKVKGLATGGGEGKPGNDALRAAALLERIDVEQADAALDEIDALVAKGDAQGALVRARKYLRVAAPGEHADRVRTRVPDLLVRIERADALKAEKREDEARERDVARKAGWVQQNLARALRTKAKAQETSIEAYAYLAKGNQTRSRRALASAEKGFVSSRDLLKRVRRGAGPGEIAEQCQREMKDADRRTVDLLTRWGELEVGNRSWKKASAAVDRGLRIDPVNRTLLDLRRTIDENWIRRRASDITNATGRSSSN